MKVFPDCIPCHLQQTKRVLDSLNIANEEAFELYREVCAKYAEMDTDITPVEMADLLYTTVEEKTGVADVFKKEKKQANDMALNVVDLIKQDPRSATWPLKLYAKLSSLGNQIDLGAHDVDLGNFEKDIINNAFKLDFKLDSFNDFKDRMNDAGSILYILDNAGEIVFDKLFMEQILKEYPGKKIFAAVRGRKILNDVTTEDAAYVGLDRLVNVINSGSPYPGIVLEKSNDQMKKVFEETDLIVSKGQGNFEGLSANASEKIFFCLMVKCDTISKYIGVEKGSTIFSNKVL